MDRALLHGKSLPINFAQGYLYAFGHELGRGTTTACWQLASGEQVPDQLTRTVWLAPLMPYCESRLADRQPLDYKFLSLFQTGLSRMHASTPHHEAVVTRHTRRAGTIWWRGCAPVCACALDRVSLRVLFTSIIWRTLDVWKWGGPLGTTPAAKSQQELAVLGMQTFVTEFHQQTGIEGHFRSHHAYLEWMINECPFCLRESPYCRIFWGITEGVIEWLYSTNQPHALPALLHINEGRSASHTIRIDIG